MPVVEAQQESQARQRSAVGNIKAQLVQPILEEYTELSQFRTVVLRFIGRTEMVY